MKKGGFVRCGWDGTQKTEMKIKEDTNTTIPVSYTHLRAHETLR